MKKQNKKTNPAQFVREVRQELSRVIWPQRRDTLISSAIVILLIAVFSLLHQLFRKNYTITIFNHY